MSEDKGRPVTPHRSGGGYMPDQADSGHMQIAISAVARHTPPASHDAGEALPQMTDRQMFNIAFNLSAEFGPEFTEANREFALAAIHEYRTVTPACFEKEMRRFDSERDNLLSDVRVSHATIATLTAEVSRLTVALAEVSAALPGPVYMDPPDGGDVSLAEQVRRMAAELEKETAHSKHLAGAVSRKIDELIAAENQCGYFKMQYSRAEQVRKEACEANAKAQAAMLWLEADLERSRKECEGLRELAMGARRAFAFYSERDGSELAKQLYAEYDEALAALSAGEK